MEKRISVRLSDNCLTRLNAVAEQANLTVGQVVRALVDRPLNAPQPAPENLPEMLAAIRRIEAVQSDQNQALHALTDAVKKLYQPTRDGTPNSLPTQPENSPPSWMAWVSQPEQKDDWRDGESQEQRVARLRQKYVMKFNVMPS